MAEKDDFIEQLERTREIMRTVVQMVDPDQDIYSPWKIKQVLDHITGWDVAIIATLRAHISGEVPGTPAKRGINDYNARTVSERETIDFAHSLREWENTRKQLIELIRQMPPEKIAQPFIVPWGGKGTLAEVVEIFAEHEEEHAREIQEILAQPALGV